MGAATEFMKRETSMSACAPIVLNGRLAEVFAALEQANIQYCLLRGHGELLTGGDLEIDLLVAAEHLAKFAHTLQTHGFVRLPSWGHAPHHFFLGYERAQGRWLKFDAVTILRFGSPVRSAQIELAQDFLRQRRRNEAVFTLALEDEFFASLLHGLLDKGQFRPERSARLLELHQQVWENSEARQNLNAYLLRHLQPALDENAIARAAEMRDFRVLLPRRKWIMRRLAREQRLKYLWRKVSVLLLRRLRSLCFAVRQPGLSIALLAPDGAGKSTLAAALQADAGVRAQLVYMGTNVEASTVGLRSTKWLHRRLKPKSGKPRLSKPLRLLLRPLNYFNRMGEQWYRCAYGVYQKRRGRFVVFDRYVYDAWIAQPASTGMKRLRRALLAWGWPTPDLVVFLDAPAEILFARKGEHNVEWLEKQRAAYLGLQARLPQMRVVAATQSAEEVKREVITLIWEAYRARYAKAV